MATEPIRPDQQISVRDAFQAMRIFLWRFLDRGDLGVENLPSILRWTSVRMSRQEGDEPRTDDPAQWHDWVSAVRAALSGVDADDLRGTPKH